MQEARFSASFKLTDKYDSAMFTVRADTIDEFVDSLRALAVQQIGVKVAQIDAHAKGRDATAQAVAAVREQFPGAQVISGPVQGSEPPWQDAGPAVAQQYPPVAQQLPASYRPACETCGAPADFKEGVSKAGKPYKGFFCTASRDHVKWVS